MINEWKGEIVNDPYGSVWWHNLEYDREKDNLTSEVLEEFEQVVNDFLNREGPQAPPLAVLLNVLGESQAKFTMRGRRVPPAEPLSRVVSARDFAAYLVQAERKLGIGVNSKRWMEMIWRRFERGKINPERHFKGELRGGVGNFFWGIPTHRFEELFNRYEATRQGWCVHPPEKCDEIATEIRNLLGLSYIGQGIGLFRIDIPAALLKEVSRRAPTTLDSNPLCVFLPADGDTEYGYTVHLRKLQGSGELPQSLEESDGRGVEEVLVSKIPFTKECHVTRVGFVRDPLPEEREVWSALRRLVEARIH
jgi:hypothetical protein